jgi:ribosomal protein S18 acetylase RimI-like enzyme
MRQQKTAGAGKSRRKNILYKKLENGIEIEMARKLVIEYTEWLNMDLSFQNLEKELSDFPGEYREPDGTFIIAKDENGVVGCVGLKKLDENVCEMKRLFVNDEYKGKGIGRKLVELVIEEARSRKYKAMRLDSLRKLESALKIYYKNDFHEIAPYYGNPYDDAVYLEKTL